MRSDSRGRDIFYGVVAVATLIVAIIGATLAYFSVTATSNEGAVNATAATVSIEYNDGQQVTAQADQLIPATLDIVKSVYGEKVKNATNPEANACIDSKSQQVCSAYRFTVRSDVERTITATLNNEHNGFTYLSYAVYDVTNDAWLELNDEKAGSLSLTACTNEADDEGNPSATPCHTTNEDTNVKTYEGRAVNSIFGVTVGDGTEVKNQTKTVASETQVYDLVLFIKENNENQNVDQGQDFSGTIVVDVLTNGSGQITGCVGAHCNVNNQ